MGRAYQFEMTPQVARSLLPDLERALWEQNQQLYRSMAPGRRWLRWAGVALCLVAEATALPYLWWNFHPQLAGYAVAIALLFALFVFLSEIDPVMRARARKATARAASNALAPVIARGPYSISYLLGDGRVETTAAQLGIHYRLEFRGLKRAIVSGGLVCLFRRRSWPVATRILYAPTADELQALIAELRAAGVEVLTVGPAEEAPPRQRAAE